MPPTTSAPPSSLSYAGDKKDSNTTLIYARNGSGKTFLSRMFRLFEDEKSSSAANLLTFGKRSGSFSVGMIGSDGEKVAKVELGTGVAPKATNDTGLIFHVFNNDYVRGSVEKSGYTAPDGIGGYIVGKGNVDASKERAEVERINRETTEVDSRIERAIAAFRDELRGAGVSANLAAYKEITVENVLSAPLPITETYTAQLESLRKLSKISDDDVVLRLPPLECEEDLVEKLRELLTTPYKRENFAQEFVERINSRIDFVRAGMSVLAEDGDVCPFCGQSIGPSAAELIHLYEEYLSAAEAGVRDAIEQVDSRLERLEQEARRWGKDAYLASAGLHEAVEAYPSLGGAELPRNPGPDALIASARSARGALHDKSLAIEMALSETPAEELGRALAEVRDYEVRAAELVVKANAARSNIAREKRECANLLCSQARARLRIALANEIEVRARLKRELSEAEGRLHALEEQNREPRRARVAEIFDRLLRDFFGSKYVFDPETFTVSCGKHEMTEANELVFSEGEKTIVAFCIYLASTVERVERDDDWKRLLFVIDDPISSLDYDYVYTMVGCIADIKRRLGMAEDTHLRFIVLTHNYSFFNIFASNGLASNLLVLERGDMRNASDDEIFPFEQHLADVIRVAEGEPPSHSTGNSIRHVIEWACHIQRPGLDGVGKYIGQNEGLKSNPSLYYICNDLSHGGHERAAGCFDDDLASSCRTALSFMEQEFKGQVDNVRAHFLS